MKVFKEYLSKLEHKTEYAEEIFLEEHVLNMTPDINRKFYKLAQADKKLAVAIEHLHNYNDIKENKSLTELLHIVLLPYNNRTIHIDNRERDYSGLAKMLSSCRNMDFVAGYKHNLFEPLSIEMWEKYNPSVEERMVLYALDTRNKGTEKNKREIEAIENATEMLGTLVAKKRKRYSQYAARDYILASKDGLHARPASYIANFMKKLQGDAWIRTDNMEVNARSIMGLLMLAATKDKMVTILYKPKQNAGEFYRKFESALVGSLLREADCKPSTTLLVPAKIGQE